MFANLALGFETALTIENLLACLLGVTLGTFVGVLPGIGPLAGISLLLPITFYLEPTAALVMLAGIYYGAQYGSSTSSILLNLPGTAASAVICLDGYPMAKAGRSGAALFLTTIASFLGGSFAIILMGIFAPVLAAAALNFGPVEYVSMMVLGLLAATMLSTGSQLKGIAMVVTGLLLGVVGIDVNSGVSRFTFGSLHLLDGLSVVVLAMGLFGISEILFNLGSAQKAPPLDARSITWKSLVPTRSEMRASWMPILRGSWVGAVIGILPGAGASIASFLSYALEKRVAKDPSRFGKGAVEGVAAPEAANNSSAQAAFIPTLTLGIPGNAVMALMLGALVIHGITPGPRILIDQASLFWGLVASFWIGNVLLVVLNLPLIGIWVRILAIPYHILVPIILFFICTGVFSVSNSHINIFLVLGFGILGYGMQLLKYPAAPLLLGFILGPLMEENLRRALLLSRGDPMTFIQSPLSATFLAITVVLVVLTLRRKPGSKPNEQGT
ncbi:tripartite tricarboxylate transporter permease [Saccharospirillum sp.]|uniref:tripartite tricarboxylate transporter permease n=1 Tax=Saccharospirillum sp. TaxID=2033801 RepID=UPI00349FD6A2